MLSRGGGVLESAACAWFLLGNKAVGFGEVAVEVRL